MVGYYNPPTISASQQEHQKAFCTIVSHYNPLEITLLPGCNERWLVSPYNQGKPDTFPVMCEPLRLLNKSI